MFLATESFLDGQNGDTETMPNYHLWNFESKRAENMWSFLTQLSIPTNPRVRVLYAFYNPKDKQAADSLTKLASLAKEHKGWVFAAVCVTNNYTLAWKCRCSLEDRKVYKKAVPGVLEHLQLDPELPQPSTTHIERCEKGVYFCVVTQTMGLQHEGDSLDGALAVLQFVPAITVSTEPADDSESEEEEDEGESASGVEGEEEEEAPSASKGQETRKKSALSGTKRKDPPTKSDNSSEESSDDDFVDSDEEESEEDEEEGDEDEEDSSLPPSPPASIRNQRQARREAAMHPGSGKKSASKSPKETPISASEKTPKSGGSSKKKKPSPEIVHTKEETSINMQQVATLTAVAGVAALVGFFVGGASRR